MTLQPLSKARIYSLDLLRGLVMIIMALDHTRDFFHFDAFVHDPLDLNSTSAGLFFTRWITHYCAPVFIFLAGTSICLQGFRKPKRELSLFILKRGLWLVFIELAVVNVGWTFDLSYGVFILQVIWAIGICMILMALIIWLPFMLVLLTGAAIVLGHNVLDDIPSTKQGFFWDLVHNGNFAFHSIGGTIKLAIVYPFLPWLGLMMLGYCFGELYRPSVAPEQRKKVFFRTGVGVILFFLLLRGFNLYGDPLHWSAQSDGLFTVMSFLNVHKYPPSLLFMCMTIGPAIIFLSFSENMDNRWTRIISVFGRVPFFYYIMHIYLLHVVCMLLFLARGHSITEVTPGISGLPFRFMIAGEGYALRMVYLVWILTVIALYPLCHWFNERKKRSRSVWMSYL